VLPAWFENPAIAAPAMLLARLFVPPRPAGTSTTP
jgi:hypothetical protein